MSQGDQRIMRRGARLLWYSVRAQWRPFALAIGGAALFSLMAVGGTVVLGRITDDVLAPAFDGGVEHRAVALGAAALVACSALRMVGVVLRRYFGQMAQRRMQVLWFKRVTDRYLDVPLQWFDEHPTGELLAHADADCERSTMAMQPLPFSLGVVVIIVVAMAQLAFVDPVLLGVALALFPGLAVLNNAYTKRVEAPASAAQARVGDVSSVAHESFEGALLVKTLGLEEREVSRLRERAEDLRRERLIVGRLRAGFEPGLDALPRQPEVQVLHGAVRVELAPGLELAYGHEPSAADLVLDIDLDRHNFRELVPGSRIGFVRHDHLWPLRAVAPDGHERSRELFEVSAGELRTRVPMVPVMITTRPDIARADCLFYALSPA